MGGVFIDNNKNYAIFPLEMLNNEKYKDFSSKEFFLYMLLLNRANISRLNLRQFSDKNGVFVYYSNEQITDHLRCNKNTSSNVLKKLEDAGLIRREYQKRGLPMKIYVNDIRTSGSDTYYPFKQPQDKLYEKSYSNSIYKEKPVTRQYKAEEKSVSFDADEAEMKARNTLYDFSIKKQKRRNKSPTII
jgi:hypothetical protein